MKRIFTSDAQSTYINALLYGEPGTGKTHSALTLPGGEASTVIIAAEPGLKTLRGHKIEVWEIESWNDFQEALEHLRESKDKLKFKNIYRFSFRDHKNLC